jgi:LPXTG-motif cell wall-anchored protein
MDEPRIWVTYLIVGILFSIAGALVFRRRRSDIL